MTVGINAVGDGVSEDKYPQAESAIRIIAFNKLAVCAFIVIWINNYDSIKYILFYNT